MLCHVFQVQIGFFDGLDVAPVEAACFLTDGVADAAAIRPSGSFFLFMGYNRENR